MRPIRVATLAALLCACVLGAAAPAHAVDCPSGTFLIFESAVYGPEPIPAGVSAPAGAVLGEGTLDQPESDDTCRRRTEDVRVRAIEGIDPLVAVAVDSRPDTVFVLGGRCSGLAETERWRCLTEPLRFRDTSYTAASYPGAAPATGGLDPGETLGEGELGGESAAVVALAGIDPAVAVGIEDRPGLAFVAAGVCPYERFANEEAFDDLRRCLEAPVWLVFDPLAASPGATVTASADRPLPSELAGASVALAALESPADQVPADLSGAMPVGSLEPGTDGRARLSIVLPEVEQGFYEAVVTCEPCGPAFGGRTIFPAGSVFVFGEPESKGSGNSRIVGIVVGALFFALAALAIVAWRRGWHRGQSPHRS